MQGKLLVDKPKDWTSFDAVNFVRRLVANNEGIKPNALKVGHIGTLDPMATGLLVLLIGKEYTRQAQALSKLDKVYQVELTLGAVSDSFDSETAIRPYSDYRPNVGQVNAVVNSFIGKTKQVPPIYSAIKVNGKRAYKLARSGKKVAELEPRLVEIYSIEFISYDYPVVSFQAHVSSGTYIRSLVNDIGLQLRSGAYMSNLRRLRIGDFSIDDAIGLDKLTAKKIEQNLLN